MRPDICTVNAEWGVTDSSLSWQVYLWIIPAPFAFRTTEFKPYRTGQGHYSSINNERGPGDGKSSLSFFLIRHVTPGPDPYLDLKRRKPAGFLTGG